MNIEYILSAYIFWDFKVYTIEATEYLMSLFYTYEL